MPRNTRESSSNASLPPPSAKDSRGVTPPIPLPVRRGSPPQPNQDHYRNFFAESHDAFVITTREGTFLDLNEAAARLFGRAREDLIGETALQVYADPKDRARLIATIESTGSHGDCSIRILRPDGKVVECLASTSAWKEKDGRIVGYRSILRDVSHERELETQLHQSQKMEAVGILAGGIAHDFNNLLQTIISYSQFAQAEFGSSTRGSKDLAHVLEAAHRAADLTKQLLTFSRRNKLESADFDVRPLVRDTVALLERTLPASISVSCELEKDLPLVHGDPTQVQQVLLNLSINAKDAMPRGGRLDISARAAEVEESRRLAAGATHAGKYVILRFVDTGCGIPQDHLPRIYDPFFTTKEPGKGTGLGLSTSHAIVTRHGGWIRCESHLGRGSCFTVYFPASAKPVSVEPESHPIQELPRGSETLLVADDDPLILAQAARTLERLGYVVLSASSGRGAWELFRRIRDEIDLVLLDLQMPVMDGLECSRQILSISPGTRVILSGGYIDAEIEETIRASGPIQVLHKPYLEHNLARAVRRALDTET